MINIVIVKLLGIDKVHLIQIQHLYEADYLLFIGLILKELVEEAEKKCTMKQVLHRVYQGHDAKTLSLIEELEYDNTYNSLKSFISFDNDTASCYDRILPKTSSLVARKNGIHKDVTFVHVTTPGKILPQIALGISEGFYSHYKIFSIHGRGQGATNSLQT
eukprot:11507555-Ditylum_brightwellii.AAC.1